MEPRRIVRHLEKHCDNCGSDFNVMEEAYSTNDPGELRCINCGFKVHEWNGGRICYLRQISGPIKPKYKIFEFEKTCDNCGSTYKVNETHTVAKDGGQLRCETCNFIVHEYKPGNLIEMKKIDGPTKDYKKIAVEEVKA